MYPLVRSFLCFFIVRDHFQYLLNLQKQKQVLKEVERDRPLLVESVMAEGMEKMINTLNDQMKYVYIEEKKLMSFVLNFHHHQCE